jgi:hypothetical protein
MKVYIGVILMAFAISPLSVMFTERFIGPNLVEPFFFLGVFLVMKDNIIKGCFKKKVKSFLFRVSLFILIFQFLLGTLLTFEIQYVYADFRTTLLLIFSLLIFRDRELWYYKNGWFHKRILWLLIIMDIVYSVLYLMSVLAGTQDDVRIRLVSPISVIVLMYLYLFKWKNVNLAFFLLAILTYHTVVSTMRNFYILFILSLIIFIIGILHNRISKCHKIIIAASLIIIPYYTWNSVYDFWMSDGSRQIHSINRVEETLNGENTEEERMNSVFLPLKSPVYYLLPKGIGWRGYVKTIQKENKGSQILSTMDSSFFYLSYHYGLIFLFFFIFYLSKNSLRIFRENKGTDKICWIIFSVVYATAFFTQATMFAYLTFAFNYGLLMAIITTDLYYHKTSLSDRNEKGISFKNS